MVGFPVNFFVQPARFRPVGSRIPVPRIGAWSNGRRQPRGRERLQKLLQFARCGGELPVEVLELPLREAQDKREVCSDPAAGFLDHLDCESRPRDQIAAIAVCAPIRSLPENWSRRHRLRGIRCHRSRALWRLPRRRQSPRSPSISARHGLAGLLAGLFQARRAQWPNAA